MFRFWLALYCWAESLSKWIWEEKIMPRFEAELNSETPVNFTELPHKRIPAYSPHHDS